MLTIAILSGIGFVLNIIQNALNNEVDVSLIYASILVISTWEVLPLAITVIGITVVIGIIGAINN